MANKNGSVTGKAFDWQIFKRVMRYIGPYKTTFWFTFFLTILLAFLAPVRPKLIQYTVDNHIVDFDVQGLLNMTMIMVGILIVEAVVQYYQTYLANWLGQTVIKDMRIKLFKHILAFKLKYFDRTAIGTLVTRAISDIETIADVFSQGILIIMGDILKLMVVVGIMFYTNWKLALICLLPLPVLVFATAIFKRVIKSAFQQVRTQVSKLNAFVQEHITGISIVQIFNREVKEMDRFRDLNKKHRNAHIRTVWAYSIFFPIVELLSASSIALLVWWGTRMVIEPASDVTVGHLMEFILYIYMLYRPIRQLADRFNVLQMGMVSSHRVFRVLDTESSVDDRGEVPADNIKGEIDFKKVWFAYKDDDWVLKDISFNIEKGKSLALVGSTGSGKSTIINLLGRFYEYNKGRISIDGVNVEDYNLKGLRSVMSTVLQDVFLFSDTIMNNITLYNTDISREEVIEASKRVGAHEFIKHLPGQYDYDVKERGGMLSVGQRQLISFIRAYVNKPKILILDEATSSIDTESEALIQHATDVLTKDRTSIIVAHRLSTIQNADKIVVLDKGEILEEGSHQELISKHDGHYKKLFELQYKEDFS